MVSGRKIEGSDTVEESKRRPKYNLWQNSAFMLKTAWGTFQSVPFLCLALAATAAGKTVAELLLAPVILGKIERGESLAALLGAIGGFTAVLLGFTALNAYLDQNAIFARIGVRCELLRQRARKIAETSYPNLLDTAFIQAEQQSGETLKGNDAATEKIWTTWTEILTNLMGFAVYLALLTGLDAWIIALVAITAAVSYLSSKRILEWGYRHRQEGEKQQNRMSYAYEAATERKYAKDIRILGLGNWVIELRQDALRLYRAWVAKREKTYLWANVIDLTLTLLRNGAAYAYLLYLAAEGELSVSRFLLYFGAVSGFAQWVTGLLDKFTELHRESLDISVLREFLDWPEPFRFGGGEKLPDGDYTLTLENVSYRYPEAEKDTISHLDLTVHPGEKLAIVGLNGAGKTTLVKLLCGFLDPTEGRVTLNGRDIRDFDRRAYYALFAAVFQDFSVLEASVAENVAQRVEGIDEEKVWACLAQAGLTEKVKALPRGVETPIGRKVFEDGVELSGGELQRLMLARALYKGAPILLLDEPTAALDPIAENDIYQKYSAMTAGKSSVFISHRLASTRFCDCILFLEHGRIAEEGTHEELLRKGGGYAALFAVQSKYYQEGGDEREEAEMA